MVKNSKNILMGMAMLGGVLGALLAAPGASLAGEEGEKYERLAREVFKESNVARSQPEAYVGYMEEYRKLYDGTVVKQGSVNLQTNEGVAAVDEAIRALKKQKALPEFSYSGGMSRGAADHVRDTGPKGMLAHTGSDGSNPFDRINRYGSWEKTAGENISYGSFTGRDVVMQLIIDDGVKSRGHRKNIYNPEFLVTGVACGYHKVYSVMCVITYAGGYREKN